MRRDARAAVRAWRVLVVLGLALSTTACGQDGADHRDIPRIEALDPTWDLSVAGEGQRQALMDGKVARVEYTTGFDAFRSCMDAEGFELHSLREVGGILEFSIPDEAVQSGVESRCYQTHFAFVDATWQFEHTEERAFIERVSGCIGLDQGDVAEPLTTRVDAERALSEAGRQVADCP